MPFGKETRLAAVKREAAAIELAGLDSDRATLNFAKPLLNSRLIVPACLWLEKGQPSVIAWVGEAEREEDEVKAVHLDATCLQAFLRLADASDEDIAKFARRWGILGIWPVVQKNTGDGISWEFVYREATDLWRSVSRRMTALLLIAASLSEGTPAKASVWEKVMLLDDYDDWFSEDGDRVAELENDLAQQKELFASVLSDWLMTLFARPRLEWPGSDLARLRFETNCNATEWDSKRVEPNVHQTFDLDIRSVSNYFFEKFRPSRLFNVLVLQLAAILTSPDGVYRCDWCGSPFQPEGRRARADRRRLCSADCRREAHLQVSRDARRQARQRGKMAQSEERQRQENTLVVS